ncbi:hypothetical protein TRFO_37502 [Tritrichomonas foetus]|uniref:Uncharacterized protein n=1 Tax=Tritrichomonas foetus TaxID=1144522 RepID=A0A1J4JDM4_9EUKA|nr:hypothetical protein TRFO_37502 [Tritrichomonas foetus]|eukprot:OHS96391.1 hypothetical protein TRFO_37502 [Tritrichomonas foetus]
MKNIFKKRQTTPHGNVPPKPQENPLLEEFSPSHPYLAQSNKINCRKIITDSVFATDFHKLIMVIQKYPQILDLIELYEFEKSYITKVANNYHEFRQNALKIQITKGFNQVMKLESIVNKSVDIQSAFNNPPFNDMMHLFKAKKYWQEARQKDFANQLLKMEIDNIGSKSVNKNKQICIYLVSLLTSVDAIPMNFILSIKFENLITTKEAEISKSKRCTHLNQISTQFTMDAVQMIKKISDFRDKYNESTFEKQQIEINEILKENHQNFNENTKVLSIKTDSTAFFDFISHPKSCSYQLYAEYIQNPNSETFKKLVHEIIKMFSISNENIFIVFCLCSLSFTSCVAPFITVRSETDASEEILNEAFQIYTLFDPVMTLNEITSKVCESQNGEINSQKVEHVIEVIKAITPKWKEMLQFMVDFTIPEYLSEANKNVRIVINKLIQ